MLAGSSGLSASIIKRHKINCLLWGNWIVTKDPRAITHAGHPGMTRMKPLARGVVWWPGTDTHIEEFVKACVPCQESA